MTKPTISNFWFFISVHTEKIGARWWENPSIRKLIVDCFLSSHICGKGNEMVDGALKLISSPLVGKTQRLTIALDADCFYARVRGKDLHRTFAGKTEMRCCGSPARVFHPRSCRGILRNALAGENQCFIPHFCGKQSEPENRISLGVFIPVCDWICKDGHYPKSAVTSGVQAGDIRRAVNGETSIFLWRSSVPYMCREGEDIRWGQSGWSFFIPHSWGTTRPYIGSFEHFLSSRHVEETLAFTFAAKFNWLVISTCLGNITGKWRRFSNRFFYPYMCRENSWGSRKVRTNRGYFHPVYCRENAWVRQQGGPSGTLIPAFMGKIVDLAKPRQTSPLLSLRIFCSDPCWLISIHGEYNKLP